MTVPTLQMEVKKNGLTQTQDGTWKLSLTVHPNDMPSDLLTAPMGKIYVAVLAAVGDDGQPEPTREQKPKKRWHEMSRAQQAGILISDPSFEDWIADRLEDRGETTDERLKSYLDISSKAELDTKHSAAKWWDYLVAQYRQDTGQEAEQR